MCNPPFYDDDEYQATVAEHEEMGEDQHAGRYAQDTQYKYLFQQIPCRKISTPTTAPSLSLLNELKDIRNCFSWSFGHR